VSAALVSPSLARGLLASPLGLLIGFSLGALGSGGSILAVPALVYAAGQSPQEATAASLLLVGTAALSGLPKHLRAGRVRTLTGVVFGLTGIGGSLAGTALNRRIDPNLLLLAFSGLILVAAWRMVTACPTCTRVGEARELAADEQPAHRALDAGRVLLLLAAGSAVGFLTGLFGVGGGFVIVPILTLLLGFAMPEAIGTSLLVVAINSVVALLARLGTAHIDWQLAAAFTVTAVIGAQIGGHVADRLDPERTLRLFAAALVLLALYTGGRALLAGV
jgi:uncharacterized membrane protein YfcA